MLRQIPACILNEVTRACALIGGQSNEQAAISKHRAGERISASVASEPEAPPCLSARLKSAPRGNNLKRPERVHHKFVLARFALKLASLGGNMRLKLD